VCGQPRTDGQRNPGFEFRLAAARNVPQRRRDPYRRSPQNRTLSGPQVQTVEPAHRNPKVKLSTPLRLLFIGNSYIYLNNLGDLVAGIAASRKAGPTVIPTLAVRDGATLKFHLDGGPGLKALESGQWDFVILQEQSQLGGRIVDGKPTVGDPGAFHVSVREFVQRIRANNATPLLFMTWARRDHPEQIEDLSKAYEAIGDELKVKVLPVGHAWTEARRRGLSADLHLQDGSHPTPTGSYLAACVIYASITGADPRGAARMIEGHPVSHEGVVDRDETVPLVDLLPTTAAELQEIAWEMTMKYTSAD
jgi:hypothetical protein